MPVTGHLEGGAPHMDYVKWLIARSEPEPNSGCWIWTSLRHWKGYGKMSPARNGHTIAHRLAYSVFVGPIPKGMVIDHKCHNRSCINPQHLEVVTNRENSERGLASRPLSRCPSGHRFSGTGERECRRCRLERIAKVDRYTRAGFRKSTAGLRLDSPVAAIRLLLEYFTIDELQKALWQFRESS
jgi:hypothetical protein